MRTISTTGTFTGNIVNRDTSDYSYSTISSSTNAYNGSSNTTYATINLKTGSGATTYTYWLFDTSSIPEGSTINSVTCTAKCYINSTRSSYITTRQIQMFTGTTAKGSATTVANSTTVLNLNSGTWTLDELRDARVRVYAVRGTSNTSTTYYFRFYGATLNVNYTFEGIAYEFNASSNVDGVTISPTSQEVLEGEEISFTIEGDINNVVVTDNGNDITSQLVEKQYATGGTESYYPSSYTTSGNISGTYYQQAVGKGSNATSTTGNNYCSSSDSAAYISYKFDTSAIPSNAIITSVACSVKGHCESTSNSSEVARVQLYAGSTTKGSSTDFTSTSDQVVNLTTGTWTRSEIDNLTLRFTIGYYGGNVSGATLTITYDIPGSGGTYYEYTLTNVDDDHTIVISNSEKILIKINGVWTAANKIYYKQQDTFIEIDLKNLPDTLYTYGGNL